MWRHFPSCATVLLFEAEDFQQGLSLIQNIPLFANIHPSEYPRLAAAFTTRNCSKHEVIVKEGESISELSLEET